jgi:hypothetical protein
MLLHGRDVKRGEKGGAHYDSLLGLGFEPFI